VRSPPSMALSMTSVSTSVRGAAALGASVAAPASEARTVRSSSLATTSALSTNRSKDCSGGAARRLAASTNSTRTSSAGSDGDGNIDVPEADHEPAHDNGGGASGERFDGHGRRTRSPCDRVTGRGAPVAAARCSLRVRRTPSARRSRVRSRGSSGPCAGCKAASPWLLRRWSGRTGTSNSSLMGGGGPETPNGSIT